MNVHICIACFLSVASHVLCLRSKHLTSNIVLISVLSPASQSFVPHFPHLTSLTSSNLPCPDFCQNIEHVRIMSHVMPPLCMFSYPVVTFLLGFSFKITFSGEFPDTTAEGDKLPGYTTLLKGQDFAFVMSVWIVLFRSPGLHVLYLVKYPRGHYASESDEGITNQW